MYNYRSFFIVIIYIFSFCGFCNAQIAEKPLYKAGDTWQWETMLPSDPFTIFKDYLTVSSVSGTRILTEKINIRKTSASETRNEEQETRTLDFNVISTSKYILSDEIRTYDFPLRVDKKWNYQYSSSIVNNGVKRQHRDYETTVTVLGFEKVKVKAGEFDAFKIEYKTIWKDRVANNDGSTVKISWFCPAIKNLVKFSTNSDNFISEGELVDFKVN